MFIEKFCVASTVGTFNILPSLAPRRNGLEFNGTASQVFRYVQQVATTRGPLLMAYELEFIKIIIQLT